MLLPNYVYIKEEKRNALSGKFLQKSKPTKIPNKKVLLNDFKYFKDEGFQKFLGKMKVTESLINDKQY